jgi:hypothetical protein
MPGRSPLAGIPELEHPVTETPERPPANASHPNRMALRIRRTEDRTGRLLDHRGKEAQEEQPHPPARCGA